MGFKKAVKEQLNVKVLINGPSGSGKTYGALRLATGLARACGGRIAAIDTENRRIRYYADEFDFDDMTMVDPYSPEKYTEAIEEAVSAGYKVLIIDSTTHEWSYCLDLINNMPGTNSYTKWKSVTPRHNAFKEAILQSPIHIIATVRGKDEYALEDQNGKKVPKKIGVGYTQREGLEFDYTVAFTLDQDTHRFSVTKDNTHLFEGRFDMLTEKDGVLLYQWANEGEKVEKPEGESAEKKTGKANARSKATSGKPASKDPELQIVIDQISKLPSALNQLGYEKKEIAAAIRQVTGGIANYKMIEDIEVANRVLTVLESMRDAKEAEETEREDA